jgi:glycosyltransferase involved in cell wall biosynthesis
MAITRAMSMHHENLPDRNCEVDAVDENRLLNAMLEKITPLIITHNEALNIERTLKKLTWARRVVVIDSGSTDDTLKILSTYKNVEVFSHAFFDFASQCNFGLTKVNSEWVLSLDADYELSDKLISSLSTLVLPERITGYRAEFVYRIYGRPLRGTLYPPRTVLYKKNMAHYEKEGHGHRVVVEGDLGELHGVIYHDDRKPLSRWIGSQQNYVREEADFLLGARHYSLSMFDRMRLMAWPAPIAVFVYSLFAKGCILDGWPGWYYVLQRVVVEALLAIEIIDRRMRDEKAAR